MGSERPLLGATCRPVERTRKDRMICQLALTALLSLHPLEFAGLLFSISGQPSEIA